MLAPTHPLQLLLGLTLWSIWFIAVYATLSVGCSFAAPAVTAGALNWINGLLLVLTLLTLAFLVTAAWRCWHAPLQDEQPRFIARTAAALHGVAAITTLAISVPILVLPPCV